MVILRRDILRYWEKPNCSPTSQTQIVYSVINGKVCCGLTTIHRRLTAAAAAHRVYARTHADITVGYRGCISTNGCRCGQSNGKSCVPVTYHCPRNSIVVLFTASSLSARVGESVKQSVSQTVRPHTRTPETIHRVYLSYARRVRSHSARARRVWHTVRIVSFGHCDCFAEFLLVPSRRRLGVRETAVWNDLLAHSLKKYFVRNQVCWPSIVEVFSSLDSQYGFKIAY